MRQVALLVVTIAFCGCSKTEPPRTSAQGPVSVSPPPSGAPQQSSQRPTVDIHVVLTRSLKDSEFRMGKPAKIEKAKGDPGEWRIYKPSGFGEVRVRYVGTKPAEILAEFEKPAESASAAMRQLALNESRPADVATETEETWKGTVGYEEWDSVTVTKTDKGWSRFQGVTLKSP